MTTKDEELRRLKLEMSRLGDHPLIIAEGGSSEVDRAHRVINKLSTEKERRVHWQGLAYLGMSLVDYILKQPVQHGKGTTEDEFEADCRSARVEIDKLLIRQSADEAEIEQLRSNDKVGMASAHLLIEAGIVPGITVDCRCDQCRLMATNMAAAGYLDRIQDRWWESAESSPEKKTADGSGDPPA